MGPGERLSRRHDHLGVRRTRLHEYYLDVVHLRPSANLMPEELAAIADQVGAKDPSALTPSWLRKLPCARVARICVVQGVLAIMLLCCLR